MIDKGALLHAIIENAIDGIITIDQRGLLESINPAACALFGYSAEEVIGRNISMLMPQPDKSQHDEYLARYQKTGSPHVIGKGLKKRSQAIRIMRPQRLKLSLKSLSLQYITEWAYCLVK